MNRMQTTFLLCFALAALEACANTTAIEHSSGSNWLECQTLADCTDRNAVQCGSQGYCLDSRGERIPLAASDGSVAPVNEGGTSSSSVAAVDASSTPAAVDATAPFDAGALASKSACDAPGGHSPLTARTGETCYAFALHGVSSITDTSAFSVPPGETFNQVYYAVPWPSGTVATSYGVVAGPSSPALRAWLFSTSSNTPPGAVSPDVTGTTLGESASLLAAWASGGCNVVLPDSIGLQLPSSGVLMVQWHDENDSATAVDDTSEFRVCTVPASARAEQAAVTWLGTEDLGSGAPVGVSRFGGSCPNGSGAPVTIISIDPYMHLLGVHMTATIERASGQTLTVLDTPFQFDDQQNYTLAPPAVLAPGDSIRSTCTFDNTTQAAVPFGLSSHQEACFAFALTYPAGSLDNGVISLIGATNTCW